MVTAKRHMRALSYAISFACVLFILPTEVRAAEEDEMDLVEEVVVTGSRIKRDVFSSTTPISILDTESAQRIGITSITELLQKSTASSGQQVDGSISTNAGNTNASEAPPDGGAGSACINLRGLGCERTLILVNGKRLGVSGIRGAPPQPDINMLPIGMVEAVDVLTGGLSTVYGADAVAGVVNVRLKQDFEGLSFSMDTEQSEHGGGDTNHLSLVGGISNDRGNVTFGMEYSKQDRLGVDQRGFSRCLRRGAHVQDEDGKVFSTCRADFPDNWLVTASNLFASGDLVLNDGSMPHPVDATRLIYTPGASNFGVEGFSTFAVLPQPSEIGGDPALRDFPNALRPFDLDRFRYDSRYNDQLDRQRADLLRPSKRFAFVANGHFDLGFGHNEEAYFETYYFNRNNKITGATEQIFPTVIGQIPLVDDQNNPILDANNEIQLVQNPLNPFPVDVSPILTLDDLPQVFDVELQQIRLVAGIRGDLPMNENWSYDVAWSYDRATGHSAQPVLLENNLFFATQTLGLTADGSVICGPRNISDVNGQFSLPDCVPADFLNMSVVGDSVTTSGVLSSDAQRDYLIQPRTNRTVTEQMQVTAYLTGDLFDISGGGTVATAFGVEWKEDTIDSQNSALGILGLNAAENPLQEGETRGERTTWDVYAELSAPVVLDRDWADVVQIDLAARYTDDENFGSEFVYRVGALWRYNEYFAANASFNTSFRAPNLREQFLADQAGSLAVTADPCRQPALALATPGPGLDRLIANCILSGADVNVLGTSFGVAIPTSTGGAAGLKPETSDSFTATLSANQWWAESYDFSAAVTYYKIDIEDTVRALDPSTIIARCYNDQPNLSSPFCDRVERNRPTSPPAGNFISFVRAGFINTGEETAEGIDITTRFLMDFDNGLALNWSTSSNYEIERLSQEFPPSEANPDGSAIVDDVGRIGTPEWTFQSTLSLDYKTWNMVWLARWTGSTEFNQGAPNPVITDVDGNIIGGEFAGQAPGDVYAEFTDVGFFNSSQWDTDTIGPVRPVTKAKGQWMNDLSVTKSFDSAVITLGVNNMFDVTPPLIGQGQGPNRNNAVASALYDFLGRSYFLRLEVGL